MTSLLVDIIEWETMLHETVQRAGRAERRLHEATPGFPASSVGDGSPGSGRGGSHGDTAVERLAAGIHHDHALQKLAELRHTANTTATLAGHLAHIITGQIPHQSPSHPSIIPAVTHAYRCVIVAHHHLDNHRDHPARFSPRTPLGRSCRTLYKIVSYWGADPAKPTVKVSELLAVDLTGHHCRSCLRLGTKRPRHRGELCKWCYLFEKGEGFVPPRALVALHLDKGARLRAIDVQPFIDAHHQRQQQQGRTA